MGKMGSICHFPRALPVSTWGHCSQILVFCYHLGHTKRGVTMTFFVLCFPSIWLSWDPQTLQNMGKMQNDKSTLFYPRAKPGRFGSLAFAMKNRHIGGQCSCILAGKARKCGKFWVFACVPNPGKQSIWRGGCRSYSCGCRATVCN